MKNQNPNIRILISSMLSTISLILMFKIRYETDFLNLQLKYYRDQT